MFDDSVVLIPDFSHINNFDCDLSFGLIIHALVDATVRAHADEVIDDVYINDDILYGESSLLILFVCEC